MDVHSAQAPTFDAALCRPSLRPSCRQRPTSCCSRAAPIRPASIAVDYQYKSTISTLVLNTDASEDGGSVLISRANSDDLEQLILASCYNGGALYRDSTPVRQFVASRPRKVALSWRWTYEALINDLESAAIVISLRWYVAHHFLGCRVVILSDSAVFFGVLAKDRSACAEMMRYARHAAAILLEYGLDLLLGHVPTDINPADGPSQTLSHTGHIVWT